MPIPRARWPERWTKLAAALGDVVVVEQQQPPAAADDHRGRRRLGTGARSSYWSAAADAPTEREITPRRVFLDRGRWYVIADDHRSGEERTFRIDRIDGVGTHRRDRRAPRGGGAHGADWFADADLPVATLELLPRGRLGGGALPTRSVEHARRRLCVVELTVANPQLAARSSCSGSARAATVVAPAEWRGLGAAAAAALLARYEADGQRRQLIHGGDAVRAEQVGQHRGRGIGVGQRVVRAHELHVVAVAQVAEAVAQQAIGVQRARHAQRAQRAR